MNYKQYYTSVIIQYYFKKEKLKIHREIKREWTNQTINTINSLEHEHMLLWCNCWSYNILTKMVEMIIKTSIDMHHKW